MARYRKMSVIERDRLRSKVRNRNFWTIEEIEIAEVNAEEMAVFFSKEIK